MRVLVTGASGFVGSHLLPVLHQQGVEITASLRQELPRQFSVPVTPVIVGDIDGQTPWRQALVGVDIILHLAARAHVLHERSPNPTAEFDRVNVEGTLNLANQAIQAGVKQFIFISSVGAMTSQSDTVLTENSDCSPDTAYGRSKLAAERQLIALAQSSGMPWTILRPPLVYGKGNPGNMERLLKLVKLGLPLPLGAIHNRRSLVYVGNLVSAIAVCLDNPKSYNQLFLVSDGQDLSTGDLIRQIALPLGISPRLLPIPPVLLQRGGDLGDRLQTITGKTLPLNREIIDRLLDSLAVDSRYLQETLDWRPPFTVEQGFAKMFAL